MQQTQHIESSHHHGYIPSDADVADQTRVLSHSETLESLLPLGLDAASNFLNLPQAEVIALAEEGLIPSRYSKTLEKYLFNKRGLIQFCKSLSDLNLSQHHVFPITTGSIIESSNAEKKKGETTKPRDNKTNQAAEISNINFESRASNNLDTEANSPPPVTELEQKANNNAIKRLNYLLRKKRTDRTTLLKRWGIENVNFNCSRNFLEYFDIKVGFVNQRLSKELRLDMRSAHRLKPYLVSGKVNITERLHTEDVILATERAAKRLKEILKLLDIPFEHIEKFIKENNQIFNEVSKSSSRKVRDKKSSDAQVKERNKRLAFYNYVFATTDFRNFGEELVEQINDSIVDNDMQDSTRNKYMIELRAIYERGFAKRIINEHVEINSYQSGVRELIEISDSQFETFSREAAQSRTERNLLTLAYYSGIRKKNALRDLEVSRIKLVDSDELTLRNASFIKIPAYNTKGNRLVTIHITAPIRDAIEDQLAYRKKNGITHENLFALDNSGTQVKLDIKVWVNALEVAGIDTKFRFHHFRHNRAFQILVEGGSFEDVRQLFGLASVKMVTTVYGHLDITDAAMKINEKAASNNWF